MVETFSELSISQQINLLGIARSTYYYKPILESDLNLELMKVIDQLYLKDPCCGRRRITKELRRLGYDVNEKRIARLMKIMGIEAIYPKPKKAFWGSQHRKFSYLLRNVKISSQNHVWGADITYIPMGKGYIYLVAVLDLFSRYVLSWKLSNNLESDFCLQALNGALAFGKPRIFNTDQGVQFTSHKFINILEKEDISISMSGKGRCWDNIFVERFWRTLKYEEVYIKSYEDFFDAQQNIEQYIDRYNSKRLHSSLDYLTPQEVYHAA